MVDKRVIGPVYKEEGVDLKAKTLHIRQEQFRRKQVCQRILKTLEGDLSY